MEDKPIEKMTVLELQAELRKRGLNEKVRKPDSVPRTRCASNASLSCVLQGRKAELLERLQEAMGVDTGGDQPDAEESAPAEDAADAGAAAPVEEKPVEEAAPASESTPAAQASWLVARAQFRAPLQRRA